MIDDNEKLRLVIRLGIDMRKRQTEYFKTRYRSALVASKQAEAAFDKAAKEAVE